MQVYCKFLKNEGYCAKGKYCEFSHDKNTSKVLCKAFLSGKCYHGKNCSFSHASSSNTQSLVRPPIVSGKSKPVAVSTETSSSSSSASQARTDSSAIAGNSKQAFSVSSAWGEKDEDIDGVYFYGAPGSFPLSNDATKAESSYAGIAKKQVEPLDDLSEATSSTSKATTRQICKFYLSGSCRYGNFCRNSHEVEEELKPSELDIIDCECGICISNPEDGMYGLLNNCDCVFCLKCIRDWRKDGLDIVKDNQRVRMCPLCRVESFFICPSPKALRGVSKQRALDAYRLSLKQIQCKVSSSTALDHASTATHDNYLIYTVALPARKLPVWLVVLL
jgi:hypothetical protein